MPWHTCIYSYVINYYFLTTIKQLNIAQCVYYLSLSLSTNTCSQSHIFLLKALNKFPSLPSLTFAFRRSVYVLDQNVANTIRNLILAWFWLWNQLLDARCFPKIPHFPIPLPSLSLAMYKALRNTLCTTMPACKFTELSRSLSHSFLHTQFMCTHSLDPCFIARANFCTFEGSSPSAPGDPLCLRGFMLKVKVLNLELLGNIGVISAQYTDSRYYLLKLFRLRFLRFLKIPSGLLKDTLVYR